MKIKIYKNFIEDKRVSMNLFADSFRKLKKFNNKISFYIPTVSSLFNFLDFKNKMRLERYLSYPFQVLFRNNNKKIDIAHIADHQYAHLVDFIPEKKKVVSVHDLIPFKYKKKLKKNLFLLKYSFSKLYKFDLILTPSLNTKKDLMKYYNIDPCKIINLSYPPVVQVRVLKKSKKEICNKFNLPEREKKILVFDTIFYKNFNYSLKIFKNVKKKYHNLKLIKIGNFTNINNINLNKDILELVNLTNKDINEIYNICDLLLFPSIYEGFGLPCLELMKLGKPIVTSDCGSLKEFVNKNCYFNLKEKKKIENHILRLIKYKNFYNKHEKISLSQYKKYNENKYFIKLNKIYNDLINE